MSIVGRITLSTRAATTRLAAVGLGVGISTRTKERGRRLLVVCGVGVMVAAGTAIAPALPVQAAATTDTAKAPADLRFMPDVLEAYSGLSRRADPLAVRRELGPPATDCRHYQGIARKDAPDGTPHLLLTRSGNQFNSALCDGGDQPGYLMVARMVSRDRNGERLRTNLLPYEGQLINRPNLAPFGDEVMKVIEFGKDGWPAYRHPGGMQVVGDLLVIGVEEPFGTDTHRATILFVNVKDPENPKYIGRFDPPDLDDPAPAPGEEFIECQPSQNCAFGADPVGLTVVKNAQGEYRYVLMVAGGPANEQVRFFRSDPFQEETDLATAVSNWDKVGRFTESTLDDCTDWPTSGEVQGGQHQMFNFVRQGGLDGPLFLVAGRRDGVIVNPFVDEVLDLYDVHLNDDGIPEACPLSNVRHRTMGRTGWNEPWQTGSFAAASGVYVSPSGELIVYITPHESGPDEVIRMGEYRALSVVDGDSPTFLPTATVDGPVAVDEGGSVQVSGHGEHAITKAFVQLFTDESAGVHLDDEPWLHVDYDDRNADDFGDLDHAGLAGLIWEEASSLRWFAPPGCTISVNDYPRRSDHWPGEPPGDGTVLLTGTGKVESVPDLANFPTYKPSADSRWPSAPVPNGVAPTTVDFGDDIEGVTFYHPVLRDGTVAEQHDCDAYYDAAIQLGWDLDNNGSYEVSGTAATFHAAELDGPTTATVGARAQHPADTSTLGTGAPLASRVTVRNVAPRIGTAKVVDSLGRDLAGGSNVAIAGLPVTLSLTFTDPGRADTQSGQITWGDGTSSSAFDSFSGATGGATGQLTHSHVFTSPGTQTITATITDDDAGATPVEFTIEVLSLEDAIEDVADELTQLAGQATDARVAAALLAARDELIGNNSGHPPTNGALDKLDANDPAGAITKLQAAIQFLIIAESRGAGDLSALKDLLGLVAEGIAMTEYEKTRAAIETPSAGQRRALATIAALITQGHQQLGGHEYVIACDSFRQATDKALGLRK